MISNLNVLSHHNLLLRRESYQKRDAFNLMHIKRVSDTGDKSERDGLAVYLIEMVLRMVLRMRGPLLGWPLWRWRR